MSTTRRSVVTIGTFDGVHRGHRTLIAEAQAEAESRGLRSVLVTFDRHPTATVRPDAHVALLTDLSLKLELLEATGVDEVVVLDFDWARSQQTPESFAEDLVTDLEAALVLVGENFRFGRDHRGDVPLLSTLGGELGFSVRGVPLVAEPTSDAPVSSRRIREFVRAGALDEAAVHLGRPFELRGTWDPSGDGVTVRPLSGLCVPPPGRYGGILRAPGHPVLGAPREVTVVEEGVVRFTDRPESPVGRGDVVGVMLSDV